MGTLEASRSTEERRVSRAQCCARGYQRRHATTDVFAFVHGFGNAARPPPHGPLTPCHINDIDVCTFSCPAKFLRWVKTEYVISSYPASLRLTTTLKVGPSKQTVLDLLDLRPCSLCEGVPRNRSLVELIIPADGSTALICQGLRQNTTLRLGQKDIMNY